MKGLISVATMLTRLLPAMVLLAGCSGGGDAGGRGEPDPPPVAGEPFTVPIVLLDSIPSADINLVDADRPDRRRPRRS